MRQRYQGSDFHRRCDEDPKQCSSEQWDTRTPFDRDVARVMHSAALRALADKTQVVSPRESLTPRTRLTHSIEVSQIGRSLAAGIGCDTALVELAGLAHDIGHPPFGHNGERALAQLMSEWGGFEANAQNIRVLTFLEPKILFPNGKSAGLNLTRAALDACVKYPWIYGDTTSYAGLIEGYTMSKYGAYELDQDILAWIRYGAPLGEICIEAQLMNWADDIAYSVHDIEDAVITQRIDLRVLNSRSEIANITSMSTQQYYIASEKIDQESIIDAAARLWELSVVRNTYPWEGSFTQIAALKKLTTELVGKFITETVATTIAKNGPGPHGRYSANICIPEDIRAEVCLLKTLALQYIMNDRSHLRKQAQEREIINQLWERIYRSPEKYFIPRYAQLFATADNELHRRRIVCDFISSLTESHVYRLIYQKTR